MRRGKGENAGGWVRLPREGSRREHAHDAGAQPKPRRSAGKPGGRTVTSQIEARQRAQGQIQYGAEAQGSASARSRGRRRRFDLGIGYTPEPDNGPFGSS